MDILSIVLSRRQAIFGIVLLALFGYSSLKAETTNCTAITSLPYTITTQGVYCFTGNLSTAITSGKAITINVNNVTIDMNGYKLGGLAGGSDTNATGIYAYQYRNITIRNGTIRGFRFGIDIYDAFPPTNSQGHLISNILAEKNTTVGIQVRGSGVMIRGNRIVDTGGSTLGGLVYGINVSGPGNSVLDNQIVTTKTASAGNSFGIHAGNADNSMISDNRLSEVVSETGTSFGINIVASNDVIVRNNMISVADNGINYAFSTGLYGDNYTSGVTTPFTGGTAAGGTNYTNP